MRSLPSRLKMAWSNNPRFTHGLYSKARWALEQQSADAMRQLPSLAPRITKLGKLAKPRLARLWGQLQGLHPATWALDAGQGRLYIPRKEKDRAGAFLGLYRAVVRLVEVLEAVASTWGAQRMILRTMLQNIRREPETVRRAPNVASEVQRPRILASVAQILGRAAPRTA